MSTVNRLVLHRRVQFSYDKVYICDFDEFVSGTIYDFKNAPGSRSS